MIPLPQIIAEIIMGLGAALIVGTLLAVWRPRVDENGVRQVTAKGRAVLNIFLGALVFVWGLASFITKNGV
jgi:hypothetical protein